MGEYLRTLLYSKTFTKHYSESVDCVWPSIHFAERFYASFCVMLAMTGLSVAISWRYWKRYCVIAPETGNSNSLIGSLKIPISEPDNNLEPPSNVNSSVSEIPSLFEKVVFYMLTLYVRLAQRTLQIFAYFGNNLEPPSNVNSSESEIPSLFAKIAYCLLRLMLALYLSLAQRTLQIFACEQQTSPLIDSDYASGNNIGIVSYMVAAPYIDCRTSQYTVLVIIASLGMLLLIVAFPLLLLVFLYKLRKLFDPNDVPSSNTAIVKTSTLSWMQYFCAPFEIAEYSHQVEIDMLYIFGFQLASVRPEMWWWPTGMLTLRSLILAILVSALPAGSVWLPLLIVMLLVVSLMFHTYYHPYHHAGDNYLETVMITHALMAYFAQIIVDALNFTGSGLAPLAGHTYIFHMFDPASVAAIGDIVNGAFTYILLSGAVAYYLVSWIYLDRSLARISPQQ